MLKPKKNFYLFDFSNFFLIYGLRKRLSSCFSLELFYELHKLNEIFFYEYHRKLAAVCISVGH